MSLLKDPLYDINYLRALNSGAPITGVFVLAGLFSFSNAYGAAAGMIGGLGIGVWVNYGAFIVKPNYPKLNTNTDCYNTTNVFLNETYGIFTSSAATSHTIQKLSKKATNLSGFDVIYSFSFNWFAALGILTTVIIGLIVSLITNGCKNKSSSEYMLFKCLGRKETKNDKKELKIEYLSDEIIKF